MTPFGSSRPSWGRTRFLPEFPGDRSAYVEQIIHEQLPICAPLADCVDVYCDRGAFSLEESLRILDAGRALGLRVRAHAEQVTHTGIAAAASSWVPLPSTIWNALTLLG